MKHAVTPPSSRDAQALFVADDVALDFANTRYGTGADEVECLRTDQNVLDWLKCAGVLSEFARSPMVGRPGTLVRAALDLRFAAVDCIERRKAGGTADVTLINQLLSAAPVHQRIAWKRGQRPALQSVRTATGPAALLAPLAERIAKLLTEGDFDLIRRCGGSNCTLWFYDRTKSHRRRWCDMAICGNRAKVAAFRERGQYGG